MAQRRILIIGGSTRAAADSVRRAGWKPVCADLFADLDLKRSAEVIPVRNYPHSLPDDVSHVHADGWFYCGALENHPDIIERMLTARASYGPLLGSVPAAIRKVRDPEWLTQTLSEADVNVLAVTTQSSPPPADGTWLQKPLASAGGRSIRIWDRQATAIPFTEAHYFQRYAPGLGLSVVFRVESNRPEWFGICRELTPAGSHVPSPFSYCSSWGPIAVNTTVRKQLTSIARILVQKAAGICGLIGLDFRLEGDTVWLLEVNPRYTASIEVLELATGRSVLNPDLHHPGSDNHPALERYGVQRIVMKQILYAAKPWQVSDLGQLTEPHDPWKLPNLADIPASGTHIPAGWPICTVMAQGRDFTEAQIKLHSSRSHVEAVIHGTNQ